MLICHYPPEYYRWNYVDFCNSVLYKKGKKPPIKVGKIIYRANMIPLGNQEYSFKVYAQLIHEDNNEYHSCVLMTHGYEEKCETFEKKLLEKFNSNKEYYLTLFGLNEVGQ